YKINQRKNNEARKEIMALLSQGELKTRDLLNVLKIKSPCLSFHMKKLIKKDFVERIPGKIDRDNKGKIVNIYEDSWKLR
ncbi:MAG: winged helix-turn-helix domain-containing protein, partial [Nanoarchaeota archaeon]|nr:winged helix-turn-helix domain-containing protein [Nanoarchaeota archaeon]MBU1445149.1 winged helix-turn-helix domain-containing protein [Nanoarchaeota archaeon]